MVPYVAHVHDCSPSGIESTLAGRPFFPLYGETSEFYVIALHALIVCSDYIPHMYHSSWYIYVTTHCTFHIWFSLWFTCALIIILFSYDIRYKCYDTIYLVNCTTWFMLFALPIYVMHSNILTYTLTYIIL